MEPETEPEPEPEPEPDNNYCFYAFVHDESMRACDFPLVA